MNNNEIVEILKILNHLIQQPGNCQGIIDTTRDKDNISGRNYHNIISLEDCKKDYLGILEDRKKGTTKVKCVSSGFPQLDELIGGFFEGELVVIASRPGIGKTSVILSMILSHVRDQIPAAIYSLELERMAITNRLISMDAKIPVSQLRMGKLTANEYKKIVKAINRLSQANMYFIEGKVFKPDAFSEAISKLINENGIRVLYIDYLQLMISSRPGRNREQEVSELMRSLKSLALEFKIPVIIASQMNRYVEWRGGSKRPFLSDLRESGSIEEIADKVIFVYRAEAYGIPVDEEGNSTADKAELIVGKNRMGPRGECILAFNKDFGVFENISWDKNVFPSLNLSDNPFNEGPF